ncbi:cupin domain-containing protein [Mastigocoleus testarum]|uniref:Cupin n=1 Tax=Mastigocoleus testarum BC008 TaxID=371196 RepID=A0A0V7ZSZ0_9CYAN|nr:cupin domain-containing protein [Mastigocoleus testarum]KST67505.1 cupin [Mastigocoleus testarum BC008]
MIINPSEVPKETGTNYPEEFKAKVAGRIKQRLGNAAGLNDFGVNLVHLQPGSCSALRHWHVQEDEFVYILEGELMLITNSGEQVLSAGMAAGFPAGEENGHHLVNHSSNIATYLEIGARKSNDEANYPDEDLKAKFTENGVIFTHKDGAVYN